MKKLLSAKYSAGAVNAAMLIARLALGILMMDHGYDKLIHFSEYSHQFINFLGMGKTLSLALVVFAEFFCSLFLILGLFTRLATIPLIITMCVVIFSINNGKVFMQHESPALYLTGFLVLLIIGPGRISVDSMIGK
ncbi:MAG TPA: DoxX family protein [Ferruginibacter sp.]|jgi:putative oxidoreductase|nr:DoxX family protein [Ferruginibacter sp.]HMU72601.1 DoxX family protein [Ferruginibacter sp.]HMX35935.1 DoxX family protein [Ferruginibacter sp.]HMX80633.1 DoxX family protein [Ferruginibacter sp.]HNA00542.1 DoxX family protein [Ferruginibacter sp.]